METEVAALKAENDKLLAEMERLKADNALLNHQLEMYTDAVANLKGFNNEYTEKCNKLNDKLNHYRCAIRVLVEIMSEEGIS